MTWAEIISLLKEAGYTQSEIAESCGCAQPTISDLATGKNTDPRTSIADGLRDLLAKAKRKLAARERRAA